MKYGVLKKFISLALGIYMFFCLPLLVFAVGEDELYSKPYQQWLTLSEEYQNRVPKPKKHTVEFIPTPKFNLFTNKFGTIYQTENLPSYYDGRKYGYVTPVKDQGKTNLCWAYASASALESNILRNGGGIYNFNVPHISNALAYSFSDYINPYGYRELNVGGNFEDALWYWTSGLGPTTEFSGAGVDAVSAKETLISTENIQVDEAYSLPYFDMDNNTDEALREFINLIKKEIMTNGSVVFYSASPSDESGQTITLNDGSTYNCGNPYNSDYYSVYTDNYYDYVCAPHAMTIIGWDDSFSKDYFQAGSNTGSGPTGDGAWIVKNSWGSGCYDLEERIAYASQIAVDYGVYPDVNSVPRDEAIHNLKKWGYTIDENNNTACLENNGGYVYYSYEDYNLNLWINSVSKASTKDYDIIYQYNPTSEELYYYSNSNGGAIIFDKTKNVEYLNEVSFYLLPDEDYNEPSIGYKIYVNAVDGQLDGDNMKLVQQQLDAYKYEGYYTVKLDEPIKLVGEQFAVKVQLDNARISFRENDNINISGSDIWNSGILPGQSYVEYSNYFEESTDDTVQIKAFTTRENVTLDSEINTVLKHEEIQFPLTTQKIYLKSTVYNVDSSTFLDYQILSKNGEDVTSFFDIEKGMVINNLGISTMWISEEIPEGLYTVNTIYNGDILDTDYLDLRSMGVELSGLTLEPEIIYEEIGGTVSLKATLTNIQTETVTVDVYKEGSQSIITKEFSVTNNVANIELNIPNTTEAGTYTIKVSAGGAEATETFEIAKYIHVESVTLNQENITLKKLETETLIVAVNPSGVNNDKITWTSSNEKVATVDQNGKVTAVGRGTAIITVRSEDGNKTDTCEITVIEPNITNIDTEISSDYNNELYKGYGGTVNISITTQDIEDEEELTVNYYKNNILQDGKTGYLTVSNNKANLTIDVVPEMDFGAYKVEISYGQIVKTVEFEVKAPILVNSIEANDITIIDDGSEHDIIYTINPTDAFNQKVKFEITDESIAMISNGNIKGLKVGSTTLTIKATDGSNVTKTVNVNVTVQKINVELVVDSNYVIKEKDNAKYIDNILLNKLNNQIIPLNYNSFINNFTSLTQQNFKLYDQSGVVVSSGDAKIITGMYFKTSLGNYTVVVKGDVNGDGNITITDISKLYSHIRKTKLMEENYYLLSGDTNKDNKLTITDVSKLYSFIRNVNASL